MEKVINKVDDEGFTALHLAAQLTPHSKAMDIAKILLCAGADVSIINNHGETSAAVARRCGNEGLACYFETKTSDGMTSVQIYKPHSILDLIAFSMSTGPLKQLIKILQLLQIFTTLQACQIIS